jgi:hypothetical protein
MSFGSPKKGGKFAFGGRAEVFVIIFRSLLKQIAECLENSENP